jgi:hypothetical protein
MSFPGVGRALRMDDPGYLVDKRSHLWYKLRLVLYLQRP